MKKFVKNLAIFTLGFVLINVLFLAVIATTDWNFSKRLEAMNLKEPEYKVIAFGNSLAMDGIDTDYLTKQGKDSYNLALGGASLATNYVMLEEYLAQCKTAPQYAVLGLGSYVAKLEGKEVNPIVDFTMKGKTYTAEDLPIYKFKWLFTELMKKLVSAEHRSATVVRGQLKFTKTVPDNTKPQDNIFPKAEYENAEWLHKIAALCAKHNVALVVIEMPGNKKVQNTAAIGPYTVKAATGEYRVYNFNNAEFCTQFDSDKDWIGNSHLNEKGAVKFTKSLLETVLK